MWKILANDGMAASGIKSLEALGHQVVTEFHNAEKIMDVINEYDVLIVRSATKVRQSLIDVMSRTKLVIRAGVGLDNIDVEYAESKGISVRNTPTASSRSVAELSFAHLMGMMRFLPQANRAMPQYGQTSFKALKKDYSKGHEIQGKRMGIIGLGRIGSELASIALGAGMDVVAHDPWTNDSNVHVKIAGQTVSINIPLLSMNDLFAQSDAISVHIPKTDGAIIGKNELSQCKDGVFLINTSRGGSIDEEALIEGLNSGKIAGAALDVFTGEPQPKAEILNHEKISLTPHIGASTLQAQAKIGDLIVGIIDKAFRTA